MTATNKHIPGKRIKTLHRRFGGSKSLRAFAREIASNWSDPAVKTARAWAGGKVAPKAVAS